MFSCNQAVGRGQGVVGLLAAALLLMFATGAAAEEVEVRNDSVVGGSTVAIQAVKQGFRTALRRKEDAAAFFMMSLVRLLPHLPQDPLPVSLVWPPIRPMPRKTRAFIDHVAAAFAGEPPWLAGL